MQKQVSVRNVIGHICLISSTCLLPWFHRAVFPEIVREMKSYSEGPPLPAGFVLLTNMGCAVCSLPIMALLGLLLSFRCSFFNTPLWFGIFSGLAVTILVLYMFLLVTPLLGRTPDILRSP